MEKIFVEIENLINNYPEHSCILSKIKEELKDIDLKLNQNYKIILIADKGIGKTTIINLLLNLNFEKIKKNKKTERKYKVITGSLETGSGATTTSEVEVIQSNNQKTIIKIIPYEYDEIVEIIDRFAKIIFNETYDIQEPISLPTELERACRNMSGLTENKLTKVDKAKDLALNCGYEGFQIFNMKVRELCNLTNRNNLEIKYHKEIQCTEKEWIKKVFRKVNLVKYEDIPLAKKIIIELNREIFDFDKLYKVDTVLDTRGLESDSTVTERTDIKNIFRESTNNIILFVDKFNSPSKSVIDIMDYYLGYGNLDDINRFGYLVNFEDGQPENVIDFQGEVDDEEMGIHEKKKQIESIFNENSIMINSQNIIYFNPMRFLDKEGRIKIDEYDYDIFENRDKIIEYKKEKRKLDRINFIDHINQIMVRYEEDLKNKKNKLLLRYENIKNKLEEGSKIDLTDIVARIKDDVISYDFERRMEDLYWDYINKKYPSTIMAINNRRGIYSNSDIFCEGASRIERLSRDELLKWKEKIISELNILKDIKNLNINQISSIDFLINDINKYFYEYMECINKYFYDKLKLDVFPEEEVFFWDRLISRWGKGAGYRNDINLYYKERLIENNFSECIKEDMKNQVLAFKAGMISILEKN
ncbi:hypothetical protein [Clostridium chrysemydis]|uniref:hypothetical protein n=1 Tax=Clostridium chrysemydis TaxID=2665504 RepID=UPI0018841FCF|nr:hypothetical protein [Clostridium chrysemydis]